MKVSKKVLVGGMTAMIVAVASFGMAFADPATDYRVEVTPTGGDSCLPQKEYKVTVTNFITGNNGSNMHSINLGGKLTWAKGDGGDAVREHVFTDVCADSAAELISELKESASLICWNSGNNNEDKCADVNMWSHNEVVVPQKEEIEKKDETKVDETEPVVVPTKAASTAIY